MLLIELPLGRRIGRRKDVSMQTGRSLVYRLADNSDPLTRIATTSVRQLPDARRANI